ncbi:MAG: hypothetical protein JSV17_15440 [Candidatus Aminicenantes bacterium]|nr:MAG: hypothetical protein JSV17_15440 [Candidatus Aminicenantes bacterium]
MGKQTFVKTGRPEFDQFFPKVRAFLENNALDIVIDGKNIRGYRTPDTKSFWIRDYSDMLRGLKYFETDLKSLIEHFAETQAQNGRIFDYVTTFPEKLPCERENWTKYVRVPVEADVEYRFVKAGFLAWQATGDDRWLLKLLPCLDKALQYVLSHPWRWDEKLKLVKRAYTIDTWDFAYSGGAHDWLQFQITEDTYWGIMHGDNSGYYEAFRLLALIYAYFNNRSRAEYWEKRAEDLRIQMNKTCWNGRFFTHFVKISPVEIPDVDEAKQLSLSNPVAINRGIAFHEQAVAIIQEYRLRKENSQAFAEWFSIDPPFPDGIFGDEKLVGGAYVNGGIMPLVGGELAKAAFDHGFEAYGVDILNRYFTMIAETGKTYLWYFPDGTPSSTETSTSPEASPSDAWGSSAMLYAFLEGLAGVEDKLSLFQNVKLSPRWAAAGAEEAEVQVTYDCSGGKIAYFYQNKRDQICLDIQTTHSEILFHVLLPENFEAESVRVGGKDTSFHNRKIENSPYVDFSSEIRGGAAIKLQLQKTRRNP